MDGQPGRDGKPANFGNLKPASINQSGIAGIATRHGYRVESLKLSLFDLGSDIGETPNVAAKHPDIVQRLTKLADAMREELGDALTARKGAACGRLGEANDAELVSRLSGNLEVESNCYEAKFHSADIDPLRNLCAAV